MDRYEPISPVSWTGRIDSNSDNAQFRMHQIVQATDLQQLSESTAAGFSLLGYACDEGVRRNKGNIGAANGPDSFRTAFANLAAHDVQSIHDLGNITCTDSDLESTHRDFARAVHTALQANQKLIAIGGGHDIAYGHYKGIRAAMGTDAKIGIINFDAHFDLREVVQYPTSGTPFWQIAQEEANFHYCCIGIQQSGNTKKLFETARELGVLVIQRNDMVNQHSKNLLHQFIKSVDYVYLTVDLDGFDMSYCPGVSAPTVNGFSYQEMRPYLLEVLSSKKLVSMDIAELNPTNDQQQQTAKTAAYLAFEVINGWS